MNQHRKQHLLQELTIVHRLFELVEELPTVFHILCGPNLLVNIGSAQNLRFRLFELVLLIPKPSLQLHCATQTVCITGRM